MLRDITQAIAAAEDLESALELLVSQTKTVMATQCCSIYLVKQNTLIFSATDGLDKKAIGKVHMPFTQGLVGLVAQREEAINLADAPRHPRFKLFPEIAEEQYRAFLAAPIIYQKVVVGVIVVQQVEPRQFTEGEEAFLMTLAAQLAVTIRSLRNKSSLDHAKQQYYTGKIAANGVAIANALVLGGHIPLSFPDVKHQNLAAEEARLTQAMTRTKNTLTTLSQRFDSEKEEEVISIFSALLLLLENASLGGEYLKEVQQGWSAESAVCRVSLRYIQQFTEMKDLYLKERAGDIRDLGQRVLRQLVEPERIELEPDTPVILITKEASASLLAEFPRQKLAGIVTELGGVNSHAAILARALGVPALIGVENILDADIDKKQVILNANRGQLLISPSPRVISEFRSLISMSKALQQRYSQDLALPTITTDGKSIALHLNAGLLASLETDMALGADGIGLYRTEIPFMLQQRFPSESEQVKVYKQVLDSSVGKPVVMRTLDVGGDKPLAYFPINEENPFLGWRGIRLSLDHPELFLVQLRAMLQAAEGSKQLSILLPMVSCIEQIDQALTYLEQAYFELSVELKMDISKPKIGIMLEVPALLYQLADVAQRVDFVSVGSNDLTQYLLAVDRNNPSVCNLYDHYHPGILRALQQIKQDCDRFDLPVSVCGELAGEPLGALLLIAMGYTRLSMNQGSLARINYLLRRVAYHDLQHLLENALLLSGGQDVRALLAQYLDTIGLAELLKL